MLSPHDRTSLFEALRPPEGFVFDAAAGTSFSLDLEALLTAPIAFALHEARHADPDEGEVEPVGLLEAIRRHAGRITLFCQGGQIVVPARRRAVFAWLEDGVVEVAAPRPGRLFHPKVWAARYQAVDGDARVLRVLCATRNLTFDPSWDTLLRVESEPYEPKPARPEVPGQAALGALFRRLPQLAHRRPAESRAAVVAELADEVARVPLLAPEPFTAVDFHALGLDAASAWPFPDRSQRALVISPFLGEAFLDRLTDAHDVAAIVSREESLDRLPTKTLAAIDRVASLSPAVHPEPTDPALATDDEEPAARQPAMADEHGDPGRRLAGLHAKLFAFDTDGGARLFTGSANATDAAFDGNVEVLAELRGPVSAGVDALLAATPGETGLVDLLVDYHPPDEPVADDDADELAWRLDGLRRQLAAMTLHATVTVTGSGGDDHVLVVTSDEPLPAPAVNDLDLRVWPVTLDQAASAQPLVPGQRADARFTVTLEGITSFLVVRASARHATARQSTTFLVNVELIGAPTDRHSRLLAAMLHDRDRLLRYLLLLLSDDAADDGALSGRGAGWLGRWLGAGWDELPLLELLLRALDRDPARLDHIDRLLADLADERDELLPDGFDDVWQPIWQHRREARR